MEKYQPYKTTDEAIKGMANTLTQLITSPDENRQLLGGVLLRYVVDNLGSR